MLARISPSNSRPVTTAVKLDTSDWSLGSCVVSWLQGFLERPIAIAVNINERNLKNSCRSCNRRMQHSLGLILLPKQQQLQNAARILNRVARVDKIAAVKTYSVLSALTIDSLISLFCNDKPLHDSTSYVD